MTRPRNLLRHRSRDSSRRLHRLETLESRQLLAAEFYYPTTVNTDFTVRRDESAAVALPQYTQYYQGDPSKILVPVSIVQAGMGDTTIQPTSDSTQPNRIDYQPAPGFVGIDVVTIGYAQVDLSRADGDASDTWEVSQEMQIAINVVDPLIAVDDWYSIDASASEALRLDVLANDTVNADYIGQTAKLSIESASAGEGVTVEIDADRQHLIYSPADGFTGVETIQYTAIDQDGYTTTGTAQVRVFDEPNESLWPEQLQQQLVQRAIEQNQSKFGQGFEPYWIYRLNVNEIDGVETAAQQPSTDNNTSTDNSTSGTNNQLADVDESDRIKTDGEFLYVLSSPDQTGWMGWDIFPRIGLPIALVEASPDDDDAVGQNMLTVVDIRTPASPTIVSRKIFADQVLSLDLHDGRLSVIAQRESQTVVSTIDVSDASDLQMISSTVVDGAFKQARRVADSLYIFTDQFGNVTPQPQTIQDERVDIDFYETADVYLDRVRQSLLQAAMPTQQVFDGDSNPIGEPMIAVDPLQSGIVEGHRLNILTFDTSRDVGGVIDWDINQGGDTILVTTESIYVTQTEYESSGRVQDFGPAIDFVFQPPTITTSIDRYELQSDGTVAMSASGHVPGTLKNSFSLDEYDGSLRIATENSWQPNPDQDEGSSVYVLQQTDTQLAIVGGTTGLAPGENIYAVRFAGDRGYVVTFRRVDPLFVLDLSDPTDPQVKGELKVPGYSQYLHVLSDQHVIGVGRDADPETGMYAGLTVSLFNVSDTDNPVLQDRFLFDGGRSTFSPFATGDAFNITDHHAINYFAGENILALPYYSQSYFSVDNPSDPDFPIFDSADQSAVATFRINTQSGISQLDNVLFDSRADRAMRVGQYLYSLSKDELKVTHLTNPDGVIASLDFERQGADDFVEINVGEEVTLDVIENDLIDADSTLEILAATLIQGDGEVTLEGNRVRFTPKDGRLSPHQIQYTARNEAGTLINAVTTIDPDLIWQNTRNRFDINDDGKLTPRDILNVINTIAQHGVAETETIEAAIEAIADPADRDVHFYSDTNGDRSITPDDILQVINRIAAAGTVDSSETVPIQLDQPFELKLNQVAQTASETFAVTPINLLQDSRCPTGVDCVREGNVSVELEIDHSGESSIHTITYQDGQTDAITVGDYQITLQSVSPDAQVNPSADPHHRLGDYRFTFVVTLRSE